MTSVVRYKQLIAFCALDEGAMSECLDVSVVLVADTGLGTGTSYRIL